MSKSWCPRFRCPGGPATLLSPSSGIIVCKCGTATLSHVQYVDRRTHSDIERTIKKHENTLDSERQKIVDNFKLRQTIVEQGNDPARSKNARKELNNIQSKVSEVFTQLHESENAIMRMKAENRDEIARIEGPGKVIKTIKP